MLIYSQAIHFQNFLAANTLNKFQWTSNKKPTFWGSQIFWGADSVLSTKCFVNKIMMNFSNSYIRNHLKTLTKSCSNHISLFPHFDNSFMFQMFILLEFEQNVSGDFPRFLYIIVQHRLGALFLIRMNRLTCDLQKTFNKIKYERAMLPCCPTFTNFIPFLSYFPFLTQRVEQIFLPLNSQINKGGVPIPDRVPISDTPF